MKFTPKGVCARSIDIELDAQTIKNVQFTGGCSGNALGISNLVKGMNAKDVIERFDGVKCGDKSTSCPDQLAKALCEMISQ